MISNLTDPVPPELITVNFITKYLLLNFQSLAKRMRNAAALSAINGTIKSRRGLFNTQEPAVNTSFTLSYRRSCGKGPGLGDFPTKRVNASLSLRQSWSFIHLAQTPYKRLASCPLQLLHQRPLSLCAGVQHSKLIFPPEREKDESSSTQKESNRQ